MGRRITRYWSLLVVDYASHLNLNQKFDNSTLFTYIETTRARLAQALYADTGVDFK